MANVTSKNINFSGIKDILAKFFKNLSWLFFAFFLLLLVFEVLEIKTSVGIILNINQEPTLQTKEKGVRINFDAYNQVVNRIEAATNFQPSGGVIRNPFADSAPAPTLLPTPTQLPATATPLTNK